MITVPQQRPVIASKILMTALPLTVGVVVLAGCTVGPDYRRPAADVPSAYAHSNSNSSNTAPSTLAEWWTVFEDPQLDDLVHEAIRANLDLRLAGARVREARALRGFTRSALFPHVGASGDYTRSRVSENTFAGRSARAFGQSLETDAFTAGFDASWEIDLFGGNRRAVESSHATLEATYEGQREVLVSVLGEVGLTYLDVRGYQKQLAVARENLRAQEQTLALTQDRFRAGMVSELDAARAEAQVATTRSQIPPLDQALQRSMHRLSILLGKPPSALTELLQEEKPLPAPAPGVPVGLPSDLLRQRPDIRRAERELAAATARIGVATAELFPRFFLTGAAGLQSIEARDFVDGGSRFWSIGPGLRWPILTAGRIRQGIRVENARQEQALIRYEQTVLGALEDVENALVAVGKERERYLALQNAEAANRRSVALANTRYRGGLVDFLNVLEAERSLLAVQDELVSSERTLGQNAVRLYKALGGGWQESAAGSRQD